MICSATASASPASARRNGSRVCSHRPAASSREREVDREREVGDAALDVPPQLGGERRAGGSDPREHRRPHAVPEQPRDGSDERDREQRELRADDTHVEAADGLHIEARDHRPPERIVRHIEGHVLAVRREQPLVEPVVPEREPLREPDPPHVVEPGGGAKAADDAEDANRDDHAERGCRQRRRVAGRRGTACAGCVARRGTRRRRDPRAARRGDREAPVQADDRREEDERPDARRRRRATRPRAQDARHRAGPSERVADARGTPR